MNGPLLLINEKTFGADIARARLKWNGASFDIFIIMIINITQLQVREQRFWERLLILQKRIAKARSRI